MKGWMGCQRGSARWCVAFLLLVLVVGVPAVGDVSAAPPQIVVNSSNDPGDGVCDAVECTLREAIRTANETRALEEIVLPAGLYQLATPGVGEDRAGSGDLDITNPLVIRGAGAAETMVDGGGLDRVFHVVGPVDVKLKDLTVQNGFSRDGGGILNRGTLHVMNCVIRNNRVSYDAVESGYLAGGGIFNAGTLVMTDSVVMNNTTDQDMGEGMGGGIWNSGKLTLTRSDATGNWGGDGGAIFNDRGTVTLVQCNLTHNFARFFGGALENWHEGAVTISRCTISGNNDSISNVGGKLWMVNSTVSHNPGYRMGGGVNNRSGNVSIAFSTISYNGSNGSAGGIMGAVTLTGSIVAHNDNGDCLNAVNSGGYNLDSDGSCGLTGAGDLSGDPMLGPLQNNSGRTMTHALLAGSPALDAVAAGACTESADQRGVRRPQDGNGDGVALCDMGAFELKR